MGFLTVPCWLVLLACAGCGARSPVAGSDAARHRALEEVRAALPPAFGGRSVEAVGSRAAIDKAWDRVLAAELGVRVTAEYEEPPRSLVLH